LLRFVFDLFVSGLGAKVFELLDRKPSRSAGNITPLHCTGELTLSNVSFVYPSRPHHVLSDVSFGVRAGSLAALVGGSGSGKSTIFHLLKQLCAPNRVSPLSTTTTSAMTMGT
jgi:ABC-type bacteriocin/lantibiotic exporter with double-glycine peptidase domain